VAEEKIDAKLSEAVAKSEAIEAEERTPSAEELAEALRLLTPAIGNADVSTVPSHGTLVTAGPRWIAESVALTSEESAISLEAEMFSTFGATFAAASGGESESARITGVSAITAAVENRLAEAELAANAKALSDQEAERRSAETAAGEASVAETPAEVVVAASNAASPAVDGIEPEKGTPEKIGSEKTGPEKLEAEQNDSPAKGAAEAPAEEVTAATFAEAVSNDEVEVKAEQNEEPISATRALGGDENQDSSSDSGGQDSMGKDVKAKSGKSNWHQIHTAPASAAANSDAVEAAKQAESGAEESPKAMAAAAAESSASMSATDASTIAKIVEEIARKLAGK
jgi:hypothetical protein